MYREQYLGYACYCLDVKDVRKIHCLSVKLRIIDFKILLITSKILQSLVPNYRENLISILPVSHYQFRRNNNGTLLESPRFIMEKTMGDRSFTVVAPVLWKGHPLPIRQTKSVDSFKRLLETYSFTWDLFVYLRLIRFPRHFWSL